MLRYRDIHVTPLAVIAAALAAIVAAGGCGDLDGTGTGANNSFSPATSELDARCIADDECSGHRICVEGLCSVEPPADSITYGIELTPRPGGDVPPQRFDDDTRSTADARLIAVAADPISGQIVTSAGEPAPPATLIAMSEDRAGDSPVQRPVRDGEFVLHVVPGDYRLQLVVDDPRWPRLDLGRFDLSDPTQTPQIELPRLDEFPVVTGELTRQPLELLDVLVTPMEGAVVVARSTDAEQLSQFATTDDDGEFQLRLPSDDETFDIDIFPGADNPLVPRARFVGEITPGTDDVSLSVGELDLELLSLTVDVSVEPLEEHEPDWEAIRVELRRSVDVGELTMVPSLTPDGVADVDLPLGTWNIEVSPPPGSPWTGIAAQIDLTDALSETTIELPARPQITGVVTDESGTELPGVRVSARPNQADGTLPPVHTDRSGQYEFYADPGDYEIVFDPPDVLALPTITDQITVDANDVTTLDTTIPYGFVASATVLSTDDEPVSRATVRTSVPGAEAKTITGTDGRFRLILPPDFNGQ